MNQDIENFARQYLRDGLSKCSPEAQMLFKRMYSHKNLEADINDVVNTIPSNELDWAMTQVANTLKRQSQ